MGARIPTVTLTPDPNAGITIGGTTTSGVTKQTNGNTVETVEPITIANNTSAKVSVEWVGTANGAASFSGVAWCLAKNESGTVALISPTTGESTSRLSSEWSTLAPSNRPAISFAALTNRCLVQCKGVAATQINWTFTLSVQEVEPVV